MASMCKVVRAGAALGALRPNGAQFAVPVRAYAERMMADPSEHATGLEKRELEAIKAGNLDPFDMNAFKRGIGTKETPNLIPSAFDSRIVGCICHEDSSCVKWMWLHKDNPRRCACGYWFKLTEKASIVDSH